MSLREPFFECVFVSGRNEYRFHVRAWTAEEAECHLREALQSHGLVARGEVRVQDARGRLVRRGRFEPTSSHENA
jgi:hypothetical protein